MMGWLKGHLTEIIISFASGIGAVLIGYISKVSGKIVTIQSYCML
jgi:hypothetical protein